MQALDASKIYCYQEEDILSPQMLKSSGDLLKFHSYKYIANILECGTWYVWLKMQVSAWDSENTELVSGTQNVYQYIPNKKQEQERSADEKNISH